MTVGLSVANLANKWLDMLGGTAFTAPATTYVKLHVVAGDPGSAGTANPSAETDRPSITWSAASAGGKAITTTYPSWASWNAGSETIAHISIWDNATAGNFLFSATLTAQKAVTDGDTLTLTSLSISLAPLAA